jgi:hypothetical protein
MITKTASPKKILSAKYYFPSFFEICFTFVSSNFLVWMLQCKKRTKFSPPKRLKNIDKNLIQKRQGDKSIPPHAN